MDRVHKTSFLLGLAAVVIPCAAYMIYLHVSNLKERDNSDSSNSEVKVVEEPSDERRKIKILYGSTTGTSKTFAYKLSAKIGKISSCPVDIVDLANYDEESLDKEDFVLILCSTFTGGKSPATSAKFYEWLKDFAYDFRVSKDHLKNVKFGIFGLGGKVYNENFCKATAEMENFLLKLGAEQVIPSGTGDDASDLEKSFNSWTSEVLSYVEKELDTYSIANSKASSKQVRKGSHSPRKEQKSSGKAALKIDAASAATETSRTSPKKVTFGAEVQVDAHGSEGEEEEEEEEEEEDRINNAFVTMDLAAAASANITADSCCKAEKEGGSCGCESGKDKKANDSACCNEESAEADTAELEYQMENSAVDLEDLGSTMSQMQRQALRQQLTDDDSQKREMVTKLQHRALTKEGYKIIGTHSAVKLCRWTKNQLRGRGGCYKHTFYGITSYQCMEATPSLACANKCVFCWRHHKNPVGTEWRWKEDSPEFIVQEAIALHQGMIHEMKGVPGVQPERLQEAYTVRHCALSLVGEPIMYPRINEMLQELHKRGISSFLVTNAQFPERIEQLDPVTQLYVSVDAATKESLQAIDRPLFKDFWERFLNSLRAMRDKRQRTVYRMTLVKDWNMEELEGYVGLIESGLPGEHIISLRALTALSDFIEIKSVTYCGKSDASSLTMQNVPWHKEVCAYGETICQRIAERGISTVKYSIATEHEHSCCILLAREDKFKINGKWHTWINYDKFTALITRYYQSGGKDTFASEDYMAETPGWATYQSNERGFDPVEQRWYRNKSGAIAEVEYKPSDSGCG